MRKYLLAIGLIALALVGAATYAAVALSSPSKEASAKGKSVVYIGCNDQNPFCHAWTTSFGKSLRAAGVKVTFLLDYFDPALQAQHMNQAIALRPDVLVVDPADQNAIVPAYRRAHAAGIPLINVLGPPTSEGQKYINVSVLTDNAALGRFAAMNLVQGMRAAGHTSGNVIALTGTAAQTIVQQRVTAFRAEMAKSRTYKVVAVEDGNWDQAKTNQLAQQLFAKYRAEGGIQGAYGMADNQAVGIVQAAQQASVPVGVKKRGLIVTGSNCFAIGIKAIRAGTVFGTATQSPTTEAQTAARVTLALLRGDKVPKVTTVKEYRITRANVERFQKICTF